MQAGLGSFIAVAALTLSLHACSGGVVFERDTDARSLPDAGIEAATLPPTWTPTVSTTPAPLKPAGTPGNSFQGEDLEPTATLPPLPALQIITAVSEDGSDPSWQRVQTTLASFRLPERFEVIDLGSGFSEMFSSLAEGLAAGMDELAQGVASAAGVTPTPLELDDLDENLAFDFIFAVDTDQTTSVVLVSQPRTEGQDVEVLMQEALAGFDGSVDVTVWQIVEGREIPSGRFVVDIDFNDEPAAGSALVYVFASGNRSWTLIYQTSAEAFDSKLSEFERSAASFEPG